MDSKTPADHVKALGEASYCIEHLQAELTRTREALREALQKWERHVITLPVCEVNAFEFTRIAAIRKEFESQEEREREEL